jgi:hypothetical protein
VSAVKEMVDQVREDMGVSLEAAVESVAATLDLEPSQLTREYVEAAKDEEGDLEVPEDY